MGFLNILGYIGIGLGAAILSFIIDVLISRSKTTIVDDNGSYAGKIFDVNILGAYVMSVIELLIIGTVMLCVIAHLRVLMAIGIAFAGAVVYLIVMGILNMILQKAWKAKTEEDKEAVMGLFYIITCLLNGAGFAVLVSVWGWF